MSKAAQLKGEEIIYLGGLPRATPRQLLDVAEGRPITPTPEILGNGPIRGTREDFRWAIYRVIGDIEMAKISLKSRDATQEADAYYSGELRNKTNIGITLVKAVSALKEPDKKAILEHLARDFSRSYNRAEIWDSLTKAAAQEKA